MGTLLVILGTWTLIAIALAICVGQCIARMGEFPVRKEPGGDDARRLGHMEKTGSERHA